MKFFENGIVAIFMLAVLSFFIFVITSADDLQKSARDSNSVYEDCEKEGDDFLVNIPRNCFGKSSLGGFKMSDTVFSGCKTKKSTRASSGDSKIELTLSIPVSHFLGRSFGEGEDRIVIDLASPLGETDVYSCGQQRIEALLEAALLDAKEENKEPQLIAFENYKITDLPRHTLSYFIEEGGRMVAKKFPNEGGLVEDIYDIYFKRNSSGTINYRVNCLSWNNECHGDAVGLISGRYNYRVHFSKKYEGSVFEIMDKTHNVLSAAYAER